MKHYKMIICVLICTLILAGCNAGEKQKTDVKVSTKFQTVEDSGEEVAVRSEEIKEEKNEEKNEEETDDIKVSLEYNLKTILYEDEAKVDVVFTTTNESDEFLWERVWEDIYLSELDPHSDYLIWEDRIYLEVQGELNCMDTVTGEEIFSPIVVGAIEIPVVDNMGNVFCTGYYGPLVTNVSKSGEILWQIDDHFDMAWPSKPIIEGDYIYVWFESFGETGFNMSQIDKSSGSIEKFYWIDDNALFWEKVVASSTLNGYPVEQILDNDSNKAWVEGMVDDGINEWILFESPVNKSINKLVIKNGYHKSTDLYLKNNRIKTLEIADDNGKSYVFELNDTMEAIEIKFEKTIESKTLKLKILSVYKGTKYNDTVISGIQFYK